MGGSNFLPGIALNSETPLKDRDTATSAFDDNRIQKRSRTDPLLPSSQLLASVRRETPPSPFVSNGVTSSGMIIPEGTTALERFRIRKMQKLQAQENDATASSSGDLNLSVICNDDSTREIRVYHRASPRKQNSFLLPPLPNSSQESAKTPGQNQNRMSIESGHRQQILSQQSVDLSQASETETVESVARVTEMQKRVDELMKEKMGITMAMAPLEARFRQKEDSWLKEQSRLHQEIDALKLESRKADEKYRDLELLFEAKEEENRNLRMQLRKESSTLYTNNLPTSNGTGIWPRQMQNDRDVMELRTKIQNMEEEMAATRLTKVSIEKELHATKIELDAVIRSHEELQDEYDELCKARSDTDEAKMQLEHLKTEHMATAAQLNAVYSDFAGTKAALNALILSKENEHKQEVSRLQFEMSVFKTRAEKSHSNNEIKFSDDEDFAVLKARIEERDRKIAELELKCFEFEEIRRQMHNHIQELRGNIRVFVRTRPFLPNDGKQTDPAIDISPDCESLNIFDSRTDATHDFKFDRVFPPSAGQDHVFDEVSDFVQSALDGYNVCLFSYGQTGSGKTHTMQGSGSGAMRGIIPRSVEKVLNQVKAMQNHKWNFKLTASFLEIYNEELKDLLPSLEGINGLNKSQKLSIKRSREGRSFVDGLSEVPIDTVNSDAGMQKLDELMGVAARSRSVASTKMNSQSSRSHSIFILQLRGYNSETGAEVHGSLNLCDLAGSERLDRSGAASDAQRLRETQSINKSLSCLGDVFNALSQGSAHVPYRNSKLTYLLQDCLSGDGKALMFVNLSPTIESSSESLCSLRFAQRVNQIELGKATKHIQYKKRLV